jgi:hypothetical protein
VLSKGRSSSTGARFLRFLIRHGALLVLLAVALLIRVSIFRSIGPQLSTDSVTYLVLQDLQPERTPGYPLFIEIIQFFNDLLTITPQYLRLIVFFQIFLLGMLNTYLVYAFANVLTRSEGFALAMGLLFNLDYFVIGFEFVILTETLSLTLLGLTLLFYLKIFQGKASAPYWAGLFSVCLLLTRPTYAAFFVCLLGLTAVIHLRQIFKGDFLRKYAKPLTVFLIINLVGIGSWSLRNKIKYDYFGISTILPYQLGYYTEQFYQKYKIGSDPDLDKYAEILIQEKGRPYDFGNRLAEELKIPKAEVSRILMRLDLKLIKENFGEYLKILPDAASIYYGYSWFWTQPQNQMLFKNNRILAPVFSFFLKFYIVMFKNFIPLLILVLLIPLAFIWTVRKRKEDFHWLCLLEGTIQYNFFVSVLLTNAGVNNMRFRIPVEPVILLVFYGALFTWGRGLFQGIFKPQANGR